MLEMEKSLAALRATAVEENRPVRTHASLPAPGRVVAWRDACLPALCVARRRGRSLACGAPRPGRAPRGRGAPAVHRWRPPRHAPRPVRMHLSCVHPVHAHASQIIKKNCTFDSNRRGSMVIDATPSYPGQRPSSAPCASLGAPGGSGQRGTPGGGAKATGRPATALAARASRRLGRRFRRPPLAAQARQDTAVDRYHTPRRAEDVVTSWN